MRWASASAVLAGVLLAGLFAARAASGVAAASAYRRGYVLDARGRHVEAGPLLDRAAIGGDRAETLWRAGRARLAAWHELPASEKGGPRGAETLRTAATRFLEERVAAPGSVWPTAELGSVYACRESAARSGRTLDLAALERGPWGILGDDGRIAIGLKREAIEREPSSYELRDQLVLLLELNGLHEDALRAMADSARVLPDFFAHPDFSVESLPRDLVETFWRTSRALRPADAPSQSRERHLLSLGQLGRRLGHLEEAEADLREALNTPAPRLARAEDAFHLGLLLVELGRLDEAESMMALAVREPVFGPGVAGTRARIAVMQERWGEALEQLREARRLEPRAMWALLEFARVAQKAGSWDQAEESLRFAILVHPEDPAPRRAMVELLLAKGEADGARRALDDYVRSFGRTNDVAVMERALEGSLDPAPR